MLNKEQIIKAFNLFHFVTVYESVRAQVEGRECVKGSVQTQKNQNKPRY